jgi:hypothetical protein
MVTAVRVAMPGVVVMIMVMQQAQKTTPFRLLNGFTRRS